MKIAYYITPHGFGHAIRSLEVIRHLLNDKGKRGEDVEIVLVADVPAFLVRQNIPVPMAQRRKRLDVGLIQKDSLRFDLDDTLVALHDLHHNAPRLIEEEANFLREQMMDAVVCDIPFLPFEAAHLAQVPSIGISNFTWDWAYQGYVQYDPRWSEVIHWIRDCYRKCSLFLRLPMNGDCSIFPNLQDVPLVGRKGLIAKQETRRMLGIPHDAKIALISFSALSLSHQAESCLARMKDMRFLVKAPLSMEMPNALNLDSFSHIPYADVVAASDMVVTKPGYGIVADCLANATPMIYTDRGEFPEYPILVRAMEENLVTKYLPSELLYNGEWSEAIRCILNNPGTNRKVPAIGARVCAERIIEFTESHRRN